MNKAILVFGGCYSNLQATQALLRIADDRGIPPQRMVCTGDVVAYGADPQAVAELIRDRGIATVLGNCEEQAAAGAQNCGCGYASGSACDRLSEAWFEHVRSHINAKIRRWMAALPRRIEMQIGATRVAFVHGAPSRINRFLYPSDSDSAFLSEFEYVDADCIVAGHSGIGFTRVIGERIWHNAGAIGLPANDGTPRGWYSLLEPAPGGLNIEHLPFRYDHASAASAMRAARLPESYADAVESGIWPSFDVLPIAEQASTATPRSPHRLRESKYVEQPAPVPSQRAVVALDGLETLWFNTGTLCNIACAQCYIESSPRNDRLAYLDRGEFERVLNDVAARRELREIGFTGGEPFLNPDTPAMIDMALACGYRVLVLTNAMLPMQHRRGDLRRWRADSERFALRVSLDHFTKAGHERLRGLRSWDAAIDGVRMLLHDGIGFTVASRFDPTREEEAQVRAGFATLFRSEGVALDAHDPDALLLLPELALDLGISGVNDAAWKALHARGRDAMCRTSRMVAKRKGAARASFVACTLLPYDERFDLGSNLSDVAKPIVLDAPACAQFCVFGAGSCSPRSKNISNHT